MNILFLANHLDTGGITSYLLSLAKGLTRAGHTVFVASSGGNRVTRFTEQGIIFIPIPIRTKSELNLFKILPSCRILTRHIREKAIDLIHANTRVTQVLARLASGRTGVPFVSTCHGFFRPRLFRRLYPCLGDKVIAISDQVRQHLIDDFKIDANAIRLVYNGVDIEGLKLPGQRSRQEARRQFGLGDGPVIGMVARLSDVKGHEYLIRAFPRVIAMVPESQLFLVGEGKMEVRLRRLVKETGIESRTVFLPAVTNVREAYYVTDIFVMPSLNEGLGLGLMEAMAWGKPVVASAVGGILNLVKDGENGLLVRPADPDGLAAAILRFLDNPALASTMGNRARLFISENFSLDKMTLETERVYKECAKTG